MAKKKITIDKLAEMVQRGFLSMEEKMDKRFEAVDKRFEAVDKRFEAVDKRFEAIENRLDKMNARINSLEYGQYEILKKLDGVVYRYEFEELRIKFEQRLRTLEQKVGIKSPAKKTKN